MDVVVLHWPTQICCLVTKGKVHSHFVFLCVRSAHLSFCASGIKLYTSEYPALLALLCYQMQSKCLQIHMMLFFHKDETIMHLSHDLQQSMGYSYMHVQSRKPAVTGRSSGQHRDQYTRNNFFRLVDLVSCIAYVPTRVQKALNFSRNVRETYQ